MYHFEEPGVSKTPAKKNKNCQKRESYWRRFFDIPPLFMRHPCFQYTCHFDFLVEASLLCHLSLLSCRRSACRLPSLDYPALFEAHLPSENACTRLGVLYVREDCLLIAFCIVCDLYGNGFLSTIYNHDSRPQIRQHIVLYVSPCHNAYAHRGVVSPWS